MATVSTPENKFRNVKFIQIDGGGGIKFYVNNNAHNIYHHYLPLNTIKELRQLASEIGIAAKEINGLSKYELATYLTQRIHFQIPEDLAAYERGPLRILDKFVDFQQIYIPLSDQERFTFRYKIKKHGQPEKYVWYVYPFNVYSDKRDMQILCKSIGLMTLEESKKYTTEELSELLNEKFLLQERGS